MSVSYSSDVRMPRRIRASLPWRPLAFTEVLDCALFTLRGSGRLVLGMALAAAVVVCLFVVVALLPALLWGDLFSSGLSDDQPSVGAQLSMQFSFNVIGLGVTLVQYLLLVVLAGVLSVAVQRALFGLGTTWADVREQTAGRRWRLVLLALLVGAALTLGCSCCPPLGLVVLTLWGVAAPALVQERIGVGRALSRSGSLIKGGFWRVTGIFVVVTLLSYLVSSAITATFALIGLGLGAIAGSTAMAVGAAVGAGLGYVLTIAVTMAYQAAIFAVLYIDLRCRREGLDVELVRRYTARA